MLEPGDYFRSHQVRVWDVHRELMADEAELGRVGEQGAGVLRDPAFPSVPRAERPPQLEGQPWEQASWHWHWAQDGGTAGLG